MAPSDEFWSPEEAEAVPAGEAGPVPAGEAGPAPAEDAARLVAEDARAFGAYARTGGWAFGLKVARSVRPGGQSAGETPKISAKEFAELAGCSPERVMRYYKAWDKAADDGMVPHFEALAPGMEVELPDADVWLTYYASRSSALTPRGNAISEAAEAEGIRPTKALEVAENPTALRAAILADPGTAEAARKALMDRIDEDPALRTELVRDIVRTDELKKAVAAESKAGDRVDYVRQIVEKGQVKTPAGQMIDAPAELREEAERHLSLLDELDEGEDSGEWAREAYDTVRDLIAETVQSDPELRVQERRAKFYSSLQKATKVFEELTFDDVDDIYEDDMVQRLEDLRQAIGACISALRSATPQGHRPPDSARQQEPAMTERDPEPTVAPQEQEPTVAPQEQEPTVPERGPESVVAPRDPEPAVPAQGQGPGPEEAPAEQGPLGTAQEHSPA